MSDYLEALRTLEDHIDPASRQEILASLAGDDEETCHVLAEYFDTLDVEELSGDEWKVDGATYRVLTDDEADAALDEYFEQLLDDGCIEGADSPYFDRDAWKKDAETDGRGHSLAGYDGEEHELNFGDLYAYRVN